MSELTLKAISFGLLSALTVTGLQAQDWSDISGENTLVKMVSGATASIEVSPGVIATGKYLADGSAVIEAWGEDFTRSWRVKGDDQVCYSSATETNCFSFEQSQEDPKRYRAKHVSTGEFTYFALTEGGNATGSSQQTAAWAPRRPRRLQLNCLIPIPLWVA